MRESESRKNLNKTYERKLEKLEEKRKKYSLGTIGGSMIIAASLAVEIFGSFVIAPRDAGYYFTSNDVLINQSNPEDYRTKEYIVKDSSGNYQKFSFDELEKIEPNAKGGFTQIPDEYLSGSSNMAIRRVEDNSVKMLTDASTFLGVVAGAGMIYETKKNQRKIDDEAEFIRGRMNR